MDFVSLNLWHCGAHKQMLSFNAPHIVYTFALESSDISKSPTFCFIFEVYMSKQHIGGVRTCAHYKMLLYEIPILSIINIGKTNFPLNKRERGLLSNWYYKCCFCSIKQVLIDS